MKLTPIKPSRAWEWMWAPYDDPTYQLVLEQINAEDIVLEIGAGDLRLSRQITARAKLVYALEINQRLLEQQVSRLPANLRVICGDARIIPFPGDISVAVLLMRHCTHFSLYYKKLQATACQRLLTNGRWGMNVEIVNLNASCCRYQALQIGWYACRCGSRGFKEGPPQALTERIVEQVWELDSCPVCSEPQSHDTNAETAFPTGQGASW